MKITAIRWKLPSATHSKRFCIGAHMKVSPVDCRRLCTRRTRHRLHSRKDGDSKKFTNAKRYTFFPFHSSVMSDERCMVACSLRFPAQLFMNSSPFFRSVALWFRSDQTPNASTALHTIHSHFFRLFFHYIFRSLRIHVDETSQHQSAVGHRVECYIERKLHKTGSTVQSNTVFLLCGHR